MRAEQSVIVAFEGGGQRPALIGWGSRGCVNLDAFLGD